jgi:hypothetical protein
MQATCHYLNFSINSHLHSGPQCKKCQFDRRRRSNWPLWQAGGVQAAGAKDEILTEENPRAAFDLNVELDRRHGRYWPRVPGGKIGLLAV